MKQLTEEQMEALYKLVEQYQEDFNYEVDHHELCDTDYSYQYGVKSGGNFILGELKAILEG